MLTLQLGDISVEVVRKDIKHVHLSVYPPSGRVKIAAPERMSLDTLRAFTISRLGWIKQQQQKMREQPRETPREYIDRESHHVWGRRCLLNVVEVEAAARLVVRHRRMTLSVRPGTAAAVRAEILAQWYRQQLKQAARELIDKWQPLMGVRVERFFVQQMKTKWGSCNPAAGTIRLNTELAKKPPECLEYIVVHEMVHLLEPTHNARFVMLLERFMPNWQAYRDQLNSLPVSHEHWRY
ncbi:MAG: M48 family metallopeptidase [Gammaproteobacteria bacterium]|nr:M48 family metallopeptidase [Gammaproteobacteria bacterium]MBU1490112.1 M48 family metallopeptidase [Gammaproteobacteria bacterium]MBU2066841.1 M48 family metallopeptidase [Gammaproteobacteria bacterium]MBU2139543.1 M48 family metallopeptidase [Gammaproteobacteria bacterium]MBU2216978.1 M48 family metallopeptidase [Gammaproteobacteria bacterium]